MKKLRNVVTTEKYSFIRKLRTSSVRRVIVIFQVMIIVIVMQKLGITIFRPCFASIHTRVFQSVEGRFRTFFKYIIMYRQLEEDYLFGSCCFPGRKPSMEVDLCFNCIVFVGYTLGISLRY